MLIKNKTDFAAVAYQEFHRDGYPMGIIAVRGIYDLHPDGKLTLASSQNMILSDEYERSPHNSQLLRVSDLIPFKPNTDITVIGYTYAPEGRPSKGWQFGIEVADQRRILQCHGLRDWLRLDDHNWHMSETRRVDRVPLDYRYACGSDFAEEPSDPNGENPVGTPIINRERPPRANKIPVANIVTLAHPIEDPFTFVPPAGLGPVPPFWKGRLNYAGSYSQHWLDKDTHYLPSDFDYQFYQCAGSGMVWRGFMRGNERIMLYRMVFGGVNMTFVLPDIQLVAKAGWYDGRTVEFGLNLDGVHIDMRSQNGPWRVDLTWRGWLAICNNFTGIELNKRPLIEQDKELVHCNVNGLEA